jgi:hypothetical protein
LNPSDGLKWVFYQIQDNAGVLSSLISPYQDTITLDSTPPVTSFSHANPSSTVSLFPSDGLSGVLATYYRIDYGAYVPYAGAIGLSAPPPYTHVIDYYSVDNAGNSENPKQLLVHYLTVDSNIAEISLGNDGWYTDGVTAWTPTAPDTKWIGTDMFGFQTWKKDSAVVPGNPISVIMSGPHWARAGYLGVQVVSYSKSGNTLYMTLRIRAEISDTLNMQAYVDGPGDNDITMDLGQLSVVGGFDIQAPTSFVLPDGLPSGGYTVYIRLFDPQTSSQRTQTQFSFSV